MLAPEGSSFETAFAVFKLFFGLRTRIPWEDRWLYEASRTTSWISSQPSMPGSATDRGGSSAVKSGTPTDKSGSPNQKSVASKDKAGSEASGEDGVPVEPPWRWVKPKAGEPKGV